MRGTGPCPQAPEPGGPQGTLGSGTVRVRRETRQVEWYTHHLALEITCSDVVGGPVDSPQTPPRPPRAKPQQEPLPHPFGVFISARLISLAQSCRVRLCKPMDCSTPGVFISAQLISLAQSCPVGLCKPMDCSTPGACTLLYFC